jgi:hypothetical protein
MQLGKISARKISMRRNEEEGRLEQAATRVERTACRVGNGGVADAATAKKLMKWMARTATFCGPGSPYRVLPVSAGADRLCPRSGRN